MHYFVLNAPKFVLESYEIKIERTNSFPLHHKKSWESEFLNSY